MHVRHRDRQILNDPAVLFIVCNLELDGQGPVRSVVVLADKAVSLKPAGERRFRARDDTFLTRDRDWQQVVRLTASDGDKHSRKHLRAMGMQVHSHAWLKLV